MFHKKVIFAIMLLVSSHIFANEIIGIGKVGDNFIYKVNGVLLSLSVNSIVDGCIVKPDVGLQCNGDINNKINKSITLIEQQHKKQHSLIMALSEENKKLQTLLSKANIDNEKLKKLTELYITKINRRNKIINTLSNKINSLNKK